jgi:cation:H+ antiporter
MLSIAFIAVGGLLLIFSAHYLVINAVAVARLVNVPPLLISLTVVAFGTSAPELVVSIDAILAYHPDIVMGNIIGSNIANVLVVLALAAIISPVSMPYHGIKSESLWMAGVTGLFALLCFTGLIAWWHGVIMVLGLVVFSYVSYRRMRADGDDADALLEEFESPESGGNSAGGKSGGLGVRYW